MAMAAALAAAASAALGLTWRPPTVVAVALVAGLILERLGAGVSAARRFGDPTPLIFPLLHLGRDVAWVTAIGMWLLRRAVGCRPAPAHSMRPRAGAASRVPTEAGYSPEPNRPLT
jgi:hypothetical protein